MPVQAALINRSHVAIVVFLFLHSVGFSKEVASEGGGLSKLNIYNREQSHEERGINAHPG